MPETTDLLGLAIDKNPVDFADTFNQLIQQKAMDALENKRIELAQSIYGSPEDDEDVGDDEFEFDEDEIEDADDSDDVDFADDDLDEIDFDELDLDDIDLEDLDDLDSGDIDDQDA